MKIKKRKEEKDKLLEGIDYTYFEIEKNIKDYLLK